MIQSTYMKIFFYSTFFFFLHVIIMFGASCFAYLTYLGTCASMNQSTDTCPTHRKDNKMYMLQCSLSFNISVWKFQIIFFSLQVSPYKITIISTNLSHFLKFPIKIILYLLPLVQGNSSVNIKKY